EEALRRSEEKFSKMFHSAPVGIAVSGLEDGVLFEVTREFERVRGYSRAESVGRPSSELGLWIDPALRARLIARLSGGTGVNDVEVALRARNGSVVVVRSSFEPLTLEGQSYLLSAFVDITESRVAREALAQSEAYFRSLIEQALDIITVLNPDGSIRYTSPANERVLGYSADEVRGHPVFDFVHPDDVAAAKQTFFGALEQPGSVRSLEVRFRHRDGTWHILEAVGRSLCDDPSVGGAIINAHDVTERRGLESQLLQARKMEAIGRLAGGVAHDFNNLLTVISGFSELMRVELSPGHPSLGYVEEIRRATNRATELTRQLLAFGRQQVLSPRVLDLNELVRNMSAMLHRLLGGDVELVAELAESLAAVRADPGQMEQVIMNLAVNGRDAMPGGGRLVIATAMAKGTEPGEFHHEAPLGAGPYVTLTVTDSGTGIEPAARARMFDPFFTTKEPGKGTGLGLSTVHGIVHQSGGGIGVSSEPGCGARFRIYLPMVTDAFPPVAPATRPAAPAHGTETVLLVEDDDGVRRIASATLTQLGYRVLEASAAAEALSTVERHRGVIDLLITDIVMPGGNGRALAEAVLAMSPRIPVLFMSGYGDESLIRHGVLESGIAYIAKPFEGSALARKVREVLDGVAEVGPSLYTSTDSGAANT
ncbi:MAG: PAS domain S-box protein, partial [Gemmatimonadaceae bacterium]